MKIKFDPYQFNTHTVNGVPIYWKNIPWANGFAYIHIVVHVGARHDPVGKEGLAHFFEHMPFNGCAGHKTQADVERIDRTLLQDSLGASTNYEGTEYHAKIDVTKLVESLTFMRDLVIKPVMDPAAVENERSIITQEIWSKFVNPKFAQFKRTVRSILYGDHPLGRVERALGWADTVNGITHHDLVEFHRSQYGTSNVSIVLIGDITRKDIENLTPIIDTIPSIPPRVQITEISEWPCPKNPEMITSAKEYFGFTGDAIPKIAEVEANRIMPIPQNSQVLYVAHGVLRAILFARIRTELGATYSPQVIGNLYPDHCLARISVKTGPESVTEIKEIILRSIQEIARGDSRHQDIFDEIKSARLGRLWTCDPSVGGIADEVTDDLIFSGKITSLEVDLRHTEEVTYQGVSSLFSEQYKPEQLFWNILIP